MLLFPKENIKELDKFVQMADLSDFLNSKMFRVSDTPLSYRQINSLSKSGLITNERASEKEWREFSPKDLIFFEMLKELRVYGLRDKQLVDLKNSFFKEVREAVSNNKDVFRFDINRDLKEREGKNNKKTSELAIAAVLNGNQVVITIDDKYFADYLYYFQFADSFRRAKSLVFLNFSEIVSNAIQRAGLGSVEYRTLSENFNLSKKEISILCLIRNRNYKKITIKKKDGEEKYILKGEQSAEIAEKQLIKIIKISSLQI